MNNEKLAMRNEKLGMRNGRMARSRRAVKKAWLSLLLIAHCSMLILLGCRDPLDSIDMAAAAPAGKGSFSLTLSGAGRTILPNTPDTGGFAVYNLAFTPADGGETESVDSTDETLSNPVPLEPGTYNLVVTAYKDSAKTQLVARGTLDGIVIIAGQNTTASVTLEALLSGGTGTFSWDITFPADVNAAMTITPISAGGTAEQTVTFNPTAAGSETLVSGQYRLTFVLSNTAGKKVEWKELLHVYQNLESVFTFTFTEDHLSDTAYTVTYQYNDDVTEDQAQSVLHSGKLTPNNPAREGYEFGGWYTDDAFANVYDFNQPVIEPFTLYARWGRAFSITLNISMVKKLYNKNEGLNLSGLVVTAAYGDGTSAAVTNYTASPANNEALYSTGQITVTISYTEGGVTKTLYFTVMVIDPSVGTEGLAYELITTGDNANTYRVRIGDVTSGDVTVPAVYNNRLVTEIADYAFSNSYGLTGIFIADGIKTIGSSAFSNCNGLSGITIPASITSIGSEAFSSCNNLRDIVIDNNLVEISSNRNWLDIFPADNLSVTFNKNPGNYAFYSYYVNTRLTGVTLGNGVTSIGQQAFYNCSGLTGVTISEGVNTIGTSAFSGCTNLRDIVIDTNQVTISQSSNWLNIFPADNLSVTFNKNPGDYAFYSSSGNTRLAGVTIGNGVTSIGERAFYRCAELTGALTIPNSVTSIGSSAFSGCGGLTSITVDVNNLNYASQDGILYNKAKTTLIQAPGGISGTVTIPDSVTSIGELAFYNCSGLTGALTIPDGVTSIGEMVFYRCAGLTGVTIPDSVTSIGSSAFSGCSELTGELTIPDGVTSIGERAFYNCSGLTGVTIGNSVTSIGTYAFYNCSGLTGELTIPDGVTSIGNYAFYYCGGLTGVTIGEGVRSIGTDAFSGCTNLRDIVIDTDQVTISQSNNWLNIFPADNLSVTFNKNPGDYAFSSSGYTRLTGVTLGNSVTSIGSSAFQNCSGLTGELTIPDSVTSIGNYAFNNCSGLTGVTIGNSVTSIGTYAFQDCSGLTGIMVDDNNSNYASQDGILYNKAKTAIVLVPPGISGHVTIPDSMTGIGQQAFYNCSGLTGITIGEGVNTIGTDAFSGCTNLRDIVIDTNQVTTSSSSNWLNIFPADNLSVTFNKNPGDYAFYVLYTDPTRLTSVTIGNGVTSIGERAFYNCGGLTGALTIPDGVTSIGNYAFYNCSGLTGVTIPDSVISIGERAFYNCRELTGALTIPDGVTSIGDYAFSGCSGLTGELTIPDGVTSIGSAAFSGCSGLTGELTIPDGVTSIGQQAFSGCSGLTGVTIGNSVTSIGSSAFYNCSGLTSVRFEGTISSANFSSTSSFPGDLRTKYLAADGGPGTYTSTDSGNNKVWTKQ